MRHILGRFRSNRRTRLEDAEDEHTLRTSSTGDYRLSPERMRAAATEAPADIEEIARPAIRIYTDADGLPMNGVETIVFDRAGYLWVGTQDGAARYNGREWTRLDMPNRALSNWVRGMCVASDGSLWFGTWGGGIAHLRDAEWTVLSTQSGLPSNHIRPIIDTSPPGALELWAGTMDEGVVRIRPDGVTRFPKTLQPERNTGWTLLHTETARGRKTIWVGTAHGVHGIEGEDETVFDMVSGLPHNVVQALAASTNRDGATVLWVGTDAGLAYFENGRAERVEAPPAVATGVIKCLLETIAPDGLHDLSVGTETGLVRFENNRWRTYDTSNGLPNNLVHCLLDERRGGITHTLWIGTNGGGLARLGLGRWATVDASCGLGNQIVMCIHEERQPDGPSAYWFGTYGGGVCIWKNGEWSVLDTSGGLPSNVVWCIRQTRDEAGENTFWIGTVRGLARLNESGLTVFTTASGLPASSVLALLESKQEDGSAVLWIGTETGLARLAGDEFTVFPAPDTIPNAVVTCLLESEGPDGIRSLWAGTNGGLARFERGEWTQYGLAEGLPVFSLLETRDAEGRRTLWVGTQSAGIALLDLDAADPGWRILSGRSDPALPNDTIYQLQTDAEGRVYAFTNKGVARLTPRSGDPREFSIETFTTEDGLPSNECNGGSSLADSLGRIWTGTPNGAALFDPAREVRDREPKPLYVERAIVNGRHHPSLDGEKLPHDENNVEFEFALLSYFRESSTRYQTQLVGFDRSATAWTSDFRRVYTNLPAGSYTFRVWGRDGSGTLSGPVETSFQIQSAPWKTWWAYLLYAGAVAGAGYGVTRYRLESLRRRSRELEQLVDHRTAELANKAAELGEAVDRLRDSEQRALAAREEAVEASRAKSVFLSNMSHELRTPLNAVIGFAQLMDRDREVSDQQRESLEIIQNSGEHLLGLINDVLSISQIEAGKLTLTEQVFDLAALLRTVREITRVRAESKSLDLEFRIERALPSAVLGDEGKLRQVLINLLGNAVKFTNRGVVGLSVDWRDGRGHFRVRDTGQGIAPEEMGKLFEAFSQTESGQKSREGTGLGLVISRNIVQLMGGDIHVTSTAGEGSTFEFDVLLPAVDASLPLPGRKRVAGLAPDQPSFRILVVDDIANNRVLLVRLLQSVGFETREAVNGYEAIAIQRAWRPHLIWMDVRMPVLDGVEATRAIRKAPSNPDPVIIALTSSVFDHERGDILKSGANDFVAKPYREETIFEKMTEHLGVRFVHEDAARQGPDRRGPRDRIAAADLAGLDSSLRDSLHRALLIGDLEEALRLARRMRATDERLAATIEDALRAFQFDELLSAFEQT